MPSPLELQRAIQGDEVGENKWALVRVNTDCAIDLASRAALVVSERCWGVPEKAGAQVVLCLRGACYQGSVS